MSKEDFVALIRVIMHEEAWQVYRGRNIKTSTQNQRRAINKLAKALDCQISPLTIEEVEALQWG